MMRFNALVFIVVALTGCNDSTTSVRLQISTAPSLTLDGLVVASEGILRETAMATSLQLLVPDSWADHTHRLEIEGLLEGATIAAGEVVVTPIAGRETTAQVTLVDARCDLLCNVGAVACVGDAIAVCEFGLDQCPTWGLPAACTTSAPFCSNGVCSDSCTAECLAGEKKCMGITEQMCGEFDADSCFDWGPGVPCPSGELCDGDRCTAAFALTVTKAGSGSGIVTSSPSGIVCGASCTANYVAGTMVTLSASPNPNASFVGWSGGGCSGVGTCVVDLSSATHVTATFAGMCTCAPEFLAASTDVQDVVLDDTHVYWSDYVSDRILRRAKAGGPTETVAAADNNVESWYVASLAVDSTHVYWTSQVGMMRRLKNGTGPIAALGEVSNRSMAIAVDSTHVYWTTNVVIFGNWRGDVRRRAKAGGADEVIATTEAGPLSLALDSSHVYWSNYSGGAMAEGQVKRRAKVGGATEDVASLQDGPIGLAIDATHIYWANSSGNEIKRRAKTSGPIDTFATGQQGPEQVTFDTVHVYWTNYAGDQVMRRPKAGGAVELFAAAQDGAAAIDVDSTHVYWGNSLANTINRRCTCGL